MAAELAHFAGNLVAAEIQLPDWPAVRVASVYSPAWPVGRDRLVGLDTKGVQLTLNRHVWVADLLSASLPPSGLDLGSWIIGGDFNLSETFDSWAGGPRGNREYLDRMQDLGLVECLRYKSGGLAPTFKNTDGGAIKHQMDHVFVTADLAPTLVACGTSDPDLVFSPSLSDHLPITADFSADARSERLDAFPDRTLLRAVEGGEVYLASRDNLYWVLTDESPVLEMLAPEDRTGLPTQGVTRRAFPTESARQRYLESRRWV